MKPAKLTKPACAALRQGVSFAAGLWPRRGAALATAGLGGLLLLGFAGCDEGQGTGQVSGTLFARGCRNLDPTDRGSRDVPNPLPSYSLDPQYFYAEVERFDRRSPSDDPPGITRVRLRLQRTSHKIDRTDGFELFIYDVDGLMARQQERLSRGEPGMPIIPPAFDQPEVPLPGAPEQTVRAALEINGSCPYPTVAPLPRGYVRFTEIGSHPGDFLAGEFAVTLEDLRAQREQGTATPIIDVGGQLSGNFRFAIRTGPASGAL